MYKLIDGVEMNSKHPETFEIPSKEDIQSLKKGDFIKLGFEESGLSPERMWVMFRGLSDGQYTGTLNNEPYSLETIKFGDKVVFQEHNILSTMVNVLPAEHSGQSEEEEEEEE